MVAEVEVESLLDRWFVPISDPSCRTREQSPLATEPRRTPFHLLVAGRTNSRAKGFGSADEGPRWFGIDAAWWLSLRIFSRAALFTGFGSGGTGKERRDYSFWVSIEEPKKGK